MFCVCVGGGSSGCSMSWVDTGYHVLVAHGLPRAYYNVACADLAGGVLPPSICHKSRTRTSATYQDSRTGRMALHDTIDSCVMYFPK